MTKLAVKFLSIPATSAPSEHVFSAASLTIAKVRARTSPNHANELVFYMTPSLLLIIITKLLMGDGTPCCKG
jgi:hypothetical protein